MTGTRNILLIGRTGNGKSTLANVLIGGENKFKESSKSVSETQGIQTGKFEIGGVNYQVIDTVGIGDTALSRQQVLYKIAEVSHSIRDGLNQIFFVTNGRFTEAEREAFDLLGEVIFDKEFVKYTTIVRTNFPEFRDRRKCEEDREEMK